MFRVGIAGVFECQSANCRTENHTGETEEKADERTDTGAKDPPAGRSCAASPQEAGYVVGDKRYQGQAEHQKQHHGSNARELVGPGNDQDAKVDDRHARHDGRNKRHNSADNHGDADDGQQDAHDVLTLESNDRWPQASPVPRTRSLIVFLTVAVTLSGQFRPAPALAIVDATVVPMTSNVGLLRNHTVLVTGDRISLVAPASGTAIPAGAQRIDGRGKFLIPGLADMHVHLEYVENREILGLFIVNGVTTVRNMDVRPQILAWKK